MTPLHHKSTHFWTLLIKSGLLFGLSLWLYFKLSEGEYEYYALFQQQFIIDNIKDYRYIAILLLFTISNWLLESYKWCRLVSNQTTISFISGIKQTLIAHAAGLLTPAKLGAFGIKPLFYSASLHKRIVLLHLFGEVTQMLATGIFGILGIFLCIQYFYPKELPLTILSLLVLSLIVFILFIYKKSISYTRFLPSLVLKSIRFIRKQNQKLRVTILALSISRYLVFAHQFYMLLWFFGISLNYWQIMGLITLYYLISSLLPVFQFLDIVVKSGVGIFVFSLANISEATVLSATIIMWLFNTVLPLLPATYLLFRFKAKALPSFIKTIP